MAIVIIVISVKVSKANPCLVLRDQHHFKFHHYQLTSLSKVVLLPLIVWGFSIVVSAPTTLSPVLSSYLIYIFLLLLPPIHKFNVQHLKNKLYNIDFFVYSTPPHQHSSLESLLPTTATSLLFFLGKKYINSVGDFIFDDSKEACRVCIQLVVMQRLINDNKLWQ